MAEATKLSSGSRGIFFLLRDMRVLRRYFQDISKCFEGGKLVRGLFLLFSQNVDSSKREV